MLPVFFILKPYSPTLIDSRDRASHRLGTCLKLSTSIHPVMLHNVVMRICKCRSVSAWIHKSRCLLCKRDSRYTTRQEMTGSAQQKVYFHKGNKYTRQV